MKFDFRKSLILPALLLFFCAFVFPQTNVTRPNLDNPNVLILHSYHIGYGWTDGLTKGFREVLEEHAELHFEFMDTKKYLDPEYLNEFETLLRIKSQYTNYDIIIASDNNAFNFIKSRRKEIYGDIPLVFCGVNYLQGYDIENERNITGVSEENDFAGSMDLIHHLYPDRKQLVCILDDTITGKAIRKGLTKITPLYMDKFDNIEIWTDLSMEELLRDISLLGDDFVVYTILFQRDNIGDYYEYYHSNKLIGDAAKVPVFGAWEFQFPHNIIGGSLLRGVDQGKIAGEMAMRILRGESPENIPIIYETPHSYMFDYRELLEHDINLTALPKDSIIINTPDTFYYKYFKELTIILVVFFILFVLLLFLILNIRRRRESERKLLEMNMSLNRRVETRTQQLEYTNRSLNDTMDKLQSAQGELIRKERLAALGSLVAGVAHEINTPLGVSITTSSYLQDQIKKVRRDWQNELLTKEELDSFIDNLAEGSNLLSKSLTKTAGLIDSFKKLSLEESGGECLEFELKEYIEEILTSHSMEFSNKGIKIELTGEELPLISFPGSFYHIVNNLLINSLIHGFAEKKEDGKIVIMLSRAEGNTGLLEYRENGKGIPAEIGDHLFEPFTTTGRIKGQTGLGLYIIYKTVSEKLGGAIEYRPLSDVTGEQGVCFRIYFPITDESENC